MFPIISTFLLAIGAGYLLRRRTLALLSSFIMLCVVILLFWFGVEMGSNRMLMNSLPVLGLESLVITIMGLLGSLLASKLLWHYLLSTGKWKKKRSSTTTLQSDAITATTYQLSWKTIRSSLLIVIWFVIGGYVGWLHLIPTEWMHPSISLYLLCCLLAMVGCSVGHNKSLWHSIRHSSAYLFLLPVATVLGTLSGGLVLSLFLDRQPTELLAIESGFAYYSLSSVLITQKLGVELGTIALLVNIWRELITLLFSPFMVRWFGPLSPISAGGATSMDTTLPIIRQVTGDRFVPLSILHGMLVDFSVPFLVGFFCYLAL